MKQNNRKKNGSAKGRSARKRSGRPVALVTGASTGIGRELAKLLAHDGYDLVVTARRRPLLTALAREIEDTYAATVTVVSVDLARPSGPQRLFDEVRKRALEVEVLVNNAGVASFGRFTNGSLADQLGVVQLNAVALTALTRLFVEPMVERGHGRILNVASVAAFQPTPSLAVYGATKAFVLSLSESLSIELADCGVTVTALCPGFTQTPLVEKAERELDRHDLIPGALMLDPVTVAREGYDAMKAGRTVCINGWPYELAVLWERMQPRWLVRAVAGLVGQRFYGEADGDGAARRPAAARARAAAR